MTYRYEIQEFCLVEYDANNHQTFKSCRADKGFTYTGNNPDYQNQHFLITLESNGKFCIYRATCEEIVFQGALIRRYTKTGTPLHCFF